MRRASQYNINTILADGMTHDDVETRIDWSLPGKVNVSSFEAKLASVKTIPPAHRLERPYQSDRLVRHFGDVEIPTELDRAVFQLDPGVPRSFDSQVDR